ncbi:MAG TPA: DNA alkylation repair protein [Nocardioidaceae bacterium]|nr:DNA alkylation repair protein [Nocardioidaceae bacterium]
MPVGQARRDVVDQVRAALAAAADPEAAPAMQAYMKSALPYYGVRVPVVRSIVRTIYTQRPISQRDAWDATVRALYDEATHREERYAALALAGHRLYSAYVDAAAMPLYKHLVATGAWWDLVDEASHRVGDALRADRPGVTADLDRWIAADSLWLRRSSIICQVGHRADTDLKLLERAVTANLADRDFFIRKAIGWALRDLSTTNPDWVRAFVAEHAEELSPLSAREALRKISR